MNGRCVQISSSIRTGSPELIDGYIFSENLERYPKYEEYLKKHVRGKKAPVDPLTNRVSKKKLKSSSNGKENGESGGGMGDLQALILAKNKSRSGRGG